jgi:cytochrome c oxidase subunit II
MKQNRFAIFAATAIVAFGMILVGCGSNNASSTDNSSSSTPAASSNSGSSSTPDSADTQVVHVTAKNFEWKFDKTEVKKGKPVKLVVTASEGFHALTITGTPVAGVQAQPGQTKEVTFTPDKAGDLMVMCTQMCGAGHGDMHTTLKVVD